MKKKQLNDIKHLNESRAALIEARLNDIETFASVVLDLKNDLLKNTQSTNTVHLNTLDNEKNCVCDIDGDPNLGNWELNFQDFNLLPIKGKWTIFITKRSSFGFIYINIDVIKKRRKKAGD